MKTSLHIFLVDDHPLITAGYQQSFQAIEAAGQYHFQITTAHSLDEAVHQLHRFSPQKPLALLLVDLKMPPTHDHALHSGEDLALLIKDQFPEVKIIIATTYNNNYRIHNLVQTLNPDGFLVKNDITPELIQEAIIEVIQNPPFYSKSIIRSLRKYVANDFKIDKLDRDLLYHLSLGTKTKDLTHTLPLSIAAIERRKKKLKELFAIDSNTDKDLLETAKELGFI